MENKIVQIEMYISKDGKSFHNKYECEEHENYINELEERTKFYKKYLKLYKLNVLANNGFDSLNLMVKNPPDYNTYYDDNMRCEKCGKETLHLVYSDMHERDSSGDYDICVVCGYKKKR